MGSPCPGRLGNADPGHTAPCIPRLGPSPNRCHCTGTAMAGARVPCRQAHRTLDPASDRQRLPSAKNGRKMGRVRQCRLAGLRGHRPQLAMDPAPAPPQAPAPAPGHRAVGHRAVGQRTQEARGGFGGFFSPAVIKWELWENHRDPEAAATLGSTPRSSSQAEREPGHSVEEIMTLNY